MANTESYQEMEIKPTYTQKILPTPSKATEQRQRLDIVSRGNRRGKRTIVQLETPSRSQIIGGRTKLTLSSLDKYAIHHMTFFLGQL